MRCEEIQEHLSAWLDREVDEALLAEIDAHLDTCVVCRREAALLQRLNEALAHLEAPITPEVTARVLARLPQQAPAHRWWRSLALAASVVIGVSLGHMVTGSLYVTNETYWEESASLDVLQDYPQGSWGAILVSHLTDEGNGT